jgi:DNA-binding NarL/FixJ family response regulator
LSRALAEPISVIFAHHSTLQGKLLLDALRSDAGLKFEPCIPEPAAILRTLRLFKAEVILVLDSDGCEHLCDIVRSTHRKYPQCRQVVLLNERQRSAVPELFRLGARGVVDVATAEIEALCRCIVHVNEGHFWLSSNELDAVMHEFSKSCSLQLLNRDGEELLSRRERDVVALLAEGLTNRDIARELGISPCTVRNYLSQIFDKVGASTRTELVRFALASGRSSIRGIPGRADVKSTHDTNPLTPTRLKRVL